MRQHSGCGLGPADQAIPRKWQVTGKAIGRSGPGSLARRHRRLSAYAAPRFDSPFSAGRPWLESRSLRWALLRCARDWTRRLRQGSPMVAQSRFKPRGEVLVDGFDTAQRTGRGALGGWTNSPVTPWWC